MINVQATRAIIQEHNGLTRLIFDLSGEIVVSKNLLSQMNALPFLLDLQLSEKAGGYTASYDVGRLLGLSKYLRQNAIDLPATLKIFREISSIITQTKDVDLYSDNLSYNADHIFIDAQSLDMKMVLFPFETGQQGIQALKALVSTLADELMSPDDEAAEAALRISELSKRPDFKMVTFIALLDELEQEYKPSRRKKRKQGDKAAQGGFWSRLLGHKPKPQPTPTYAVQEPIPITHDQILAKNDGGTELLIPEDETTFLINPEQKKTIKLSLSANGMESQAEITQFPCVLGRSPSDAHVVLEDSRVSRKHAIIDFSGDGAYISDAGSSNGVFYHGIKLPSDERQLLAVGDTIKIGRVDILVADIIGM